MTNTGAAETTAAAPSGHTPAAAGAPAPETPWRTTIYGLLGHLHQPRFLVLPPSGQAAEDDASADGNKAASAWSLPHVAAGRKMWFSEMADVAALFREHYGFDAVILNCLAYADDDAARQRHALYALEPRESSWAPPVGGRWLGRADLSPEAGVPHHILAGVSEVAEPLLRAALHTWLAEAEGAPVPPARNPWTQPGWFAQAVAWIEAQLAMHDLASTGPVEQAKSWSISCVLRVPTHLSTSVPTAIGTGATGTIYFKAVPPLFGAEPVITRALAQRFPGYVPRVLAIDPPRRWLLMEDAGPPLRRSQDAPLWERVIRAFAEIQRAYAPLPHRATNSPIDDLLAMGCADRRLHVLANQIDLLLEEAPTLDENAAEPAAQLQPLAPRLRDLCAELAAAEVPQTLVHGDLHAGNVALRDHGNGGHGGNREPVFFDWTDACVAHPFQDYVTLVSEDPQNPLVAAYDRLRDVYLETWTDYAPPARLRTLFEVGKTLGGLHQAVSYQLIIRSVERAAGHEWSGALAHWLRYVLRRVQSPDPAKGMPDPGRPD